MSAGDFSEMLTAITGKNTKGFSPPVAGDLRQNRNRSLIIGVPMIFPGNDMPTAGLTAFIVMYEWMTSSAFW